MVIKAVLEKNFIGRKYLALEAMHVLYMNVVPRSTMNTNGGTEN